MKFAYCPKCKELRVKPWYAMRTICSRCRDDAREITVKRTWLSYLLYSMMGAILVLVYSYTRTDISILLYGAIAVLVGAFVVQALELSRGERVARSRIKATKSDVDGFKERGWLDK